MQDLASEFSKIFREGGILDPHSERGDPSRTQHPASAPVLGLKPWYPQLFSRGCTPLATYCRNVGVSQLTAFTATIADAVFVVAVAAAAAAA